LCRQYLPVLKEQWVLAFRALAQTTRADAGQVIPYYLLPSLGGARTHRGYSDFRFQDRHLLLLSGEYRWMPSRVLDMAIFVDAGEVAPERRDLDLTGLKTAVGIGGRFHGPTMTPLRVDLARGDEGFRLHITGGVSF
jgi:outer membrane translocation and assembly module TamA